MKEEPIRNSGVEKYKNWNEKFTSGAREYIWTCRRKKLLAHLKTGQMRLSSLRNRKKKEWRKRNRTIWELWSTVKWINNLNNRSPRDSRAERIFEEMVTKSYQNLMKYINLNIWRVQWTPNRNSSKRISPRYIRIKLSKVKDKESSKQHCRSNSSCTRDPS